MRKGGGKAKGAEFERDICKQLSLWISTGTQEDVFWRSAMSGGRSTVAAAKGKRLATQAGDISSVSPLGHNFIENFYVECKFYRDLKFQGILTTIGPLATFWATTKGEAFLYNKLPFLVAKQNQQPPFVCLSYNGLEALGLRKTQCALTVPPWGMNTILLKDFLNQAKFDPANIKLARESTHVGLGGARRFRKMAEPS